MEIIKDLILTDCFFIKCLIDTGGMRLSDYLDNMNRSFVPLKNVTMIDLDKGASLSSHEAFVRTDEIVIAHELLDVCGDRNMRNLVDAGAFSRRVALHHAGGFGIEISGRMRPGAFEGIDREKSFFVVRDVEVVGPDPAINKEFKLISSLPYAIVNREQFGYIFSQ